MHVDRNLSSTISRSSISWCDKFVAFSLTSLGRKSKRDRGEKGQLQIDREVEQNKTLRRKNLEIVIEKLV